jgi:hypothetical protein
MRDAADHGWRPDRLAIIRHEKLEIMELQPRQQVAGTHTTGGKFAPPLVRRPGAQDFLFGGQQRCGIPRAREFGNQHAAREKTGKTGREFGGVRFDGGHPKK